MQLEPSGQEPMIRLMKRILHLRNQSGVMKQLIKVREGMANLVQECLARKKLLMLVLIR